MHKIFFSLVIGILATLLVFQFSGCTQVDQIKTSVADQLAFDFGNRAMAKKDYAAAAAHYRSAVAAGNAEAGYYLGLLSAGGGDIPINEDEAFRSMRMSAEKGYAPAQEHLGMWYLVGTVAPKDPPEAARWFNKAADQGDRSAMFFLGTMYAKGQGVPKDYSTALGWFQMASAKGFPVPPEYLTMDGIATLDREYQSAQIPTEKSVVPSRAATVRNVQDGLTQLGYQPGPVDGMMGKKTANAIKAFQQDVNLPVDGRVSAALMRRIDEKLAE